MINAQCPFLIFNYKSGAFRWHFSERQHFSEGHQKECKRIIRKVCKFLGDELDTLVMVAEGRILAKMLVLMRNSSHPPHKTLQGQRNTLSSRLLLSCCRKEHFYRSFLPAASNCTTQHPNLTFYPCIIVHLCIISTGQNGNY